MAEWKMALAVCWPEESLVVNIVRRCNLCKLAQGEVWFYRYY